MSQTQQRRRGKPKPSASLRSVFQRSPFFDSGVLAEPQLIFGGQHRHPDQKTGLGLYGPYTLPNATDPPLASLTVGMVGPANMLAGAALWLDACRGVLRNSGAEPFLYPHFPGMNSEAPFRCQLLEGETWRESIKPADLTAALAVGDFYGRVKAVTRLYVAAIQVLAEREPRPSVILCCIPQEVIDICTVKTERDGEKVRRKLTSAEKAGLKALRSGQGFLFPEFTPSLGIEDQVRGHHNLRRAIKAESMAYGIPTQLVWPETLSLVGADPAPGHRRLQDVATRAWNFTTALYHKAGASPWRLDEIESGTCYVGVSFYRDSSGPSPSLRTSMAQAFTAAGDGYVLRGSAFEWNASRHGPSPHLDAVNAAGLMRGVLELYQRQNRGSLPSRVVIHKSSRYWPEELTGFREACASVPRTDFVALGWRGIQFYRPGIYPPLRGTFVRFSDDDLLLYTVGYVPYLRTYPGARVPQPIGVIEHHGDSAWDVVLKEILGLTKMNWNTADFACSEPITIAFSRRVGQILAELPPQLMPRPEYRFYM